MVLWAALDWKCSAAHGGYLRATVIYILHPWPRLAVLQTSLQVIPAWSQLGFPSPPKNVEDVDCASLSVAANHRGIDLERGLDMAGYGRMPKGWA